MTCFRRCPPLEAGEWPNAIAFPQSKSQLDGEETQVVEWLTAERGQLFVIPSSCLFHVEPGDAGAERRAWGFALDHAFRILGGWMEDNAKAAMEGELKVFCVRGISA